MDDIDRALGTGNRGRALGACRWSSEFCCGDGAAVGISGGGFQFSGPRNGVAAIWHRYGGPKLHENPRVTSVVRASDIPTGHEGLTGEQRN